MTHDQAVQMAIAKFAEVCKAAEGRKLFDTVPAAFPIDGAAISHRQWTVRDKDPMTHQNVVRVWHSSPDRVSVQIRSNNRIMTASIPMGVAKDIGLQLIYQSDALSLNDLDQLTQWMATA